MWPEIIPTKDVMDVFEKKLKLLDFSYKSMETRLKDMLNEEKPDWNVILVKKMDMDNNRQSRDYLMEIRNEIFGKAKIKLPEELTNK